MGANFGPLMDLITETISKDSWEEGGGVGKGKMEPFANGVYVDAAGVLQRAVRTANSKQLVAARLAALAASDNADSRRGSPLRKISLTRLEKHVQLALAAGRPLDRDMLNLAGLEKIKYVLVYPETGDLVLAGPAGDWRVDDEGRRVSRASGRPVLQLDDLVVVLRFLTASPAGTFGCSIDPTAKAWPAPSNSPRRRAPSRFLPASGRPGSRISASRWAARRSRSTASIRGPAWPACWSRPITA